MSNSAPIILVGMQRSGTTWLGGVFSRHSRLAYWEEPRHVWTWGNGYKPDDVLTELDATPKIVSHIRNTFRDFVRQRGAERLAEKTPSNCLRLRFIRAVYPEAKIVLIIRDGRSVIRSTGKIMQTGVPVGRVWRRARQTPLREWPAYAPRALGAIHRRLRRKPLNYWGARPPGWRQWVREDPHPVILAKQWSGSILRAWEDADMFDDDHLMRVRYEKLLLRPREEMTRVVEFLRLSDAYDLIDSVSASADPSRIARWREDIDEATLELIKPHMAPALERLGYEW